MIGNARPAAFNTNYPKLSAGAKSLIVGDAALCKSAQAFRDGVLAKIPPASLKKIETLRLHSSFDGSEDDVLDAKGVLSAAAETLQNFKNLQIEHLATKNFEIALPKLKTLDLVDPEMCDAKWDINAPGLVCRGWCATLASVLVLVLL